VPISLPWSRPAFLSVKGVLHQPDVKPALKPESRDAILLAIAKARCWIEDLASSRVQSFAEIAKREGKVERYIRLLTPLAFTPPQTLAAIIAWIKRSHRHRALPHDPLGVAAVSALVAFIIGWLLAVS
jgi:hypothetical protein